MSAAGRPLPNLVIAGVGKAGTTSLFRWLGRHPDVCASAVKETDHFAPLRHEGGRVGPLADYAATVAHCGDQRWRLEASPAYCYGGEPVVRALRATLQDPRIVLCLRDPVDRLWSNHRDLHSRGSLPPGMDMAAFVAACARLRASGEDRLPRHRAYRGLSIGHYEEYVPIWLDAFGDDLRVVFFDDLVADPAGVVAGLCRWLGIDAAGAAGLVDGAHNRTVRHRSEALRRLAYGLNTLGRPVLRSRSGIVRALRTTYERLNAIPEEPALDPAVRSDLAAAHAPGLAVLADALRAAGYRDLPPWLAAAAVAP